MTKLRTLELVNDKDSQGWILEYRSPGRYNSYYIKFDWWEEMGYMSNPNEHEYEPTIEQALSYLVFKNKSRN